jgi:phage terminase small subunit
MSLPRLKLADSSEPITEPSASIIPEKRNRKFSPQFMRMYMDPDLREQNRLKAAENSTQYTKPLNRRQVRFVKELLSDPGRNASQAAIRAGYGENSASEMARVNLKHPQIKALVEEEDRKLFSRLDISAERVTKEIAAIAFSRLPDFLSPDRDTNGAYQVDLSQVDAVQAAAVEEYTVEKIGGSVRTKIKLYDKMQALTLLGRITGVQLDNKTPAVQNNLALTIDLIDDIVNEPVTIEGGR